MVKNNCYPLRDRQAGFTLIELMVVVVIMAVVVAVGILSLGRLNQDRLQTEQAKIESLLQQVMDEATFKQKLVLMVPDEQGLQFFSQNNYQWQKDSKLSPIKWNANFTIDWDIDNTLISQQSLPKADGRSLQGWLFWPSGEVVAGEITLTMIEQNQETSTSIIWNERLQFKELTQ